MLGSIELINEEGEHEFIYRGTPKYTAPVTIAL